MTEQIVEVQISLDRVILSLCNIIIGCYLLCAVLQSFKDLRLVATTGVLKSHILNDSLIFTRH